MNQFLVLGLNHTTAPLAVRERLAFDADGARAALTALRDRFEGIEVVLLSTCNRVELYVASPAVAADRGGALVRELIEFLASIRQLDARQFDSHLYVRNGREMVSHAFTVAASLESMVLGETQILGQLRESYESAQKLGAVGGQLNPLFQRALTVGKEVLSQTALGDGRLSVASVAVDYARRIFERFDDKTILSIGAGKMAGLLLRHFAALQPKRLLICNRDARKAEALASVHGGVPVPYESLNQHLAAADIVSSSTGAPKPILTKQQVDAALKARRYRPMFLIDIAVPRDIEPAVADLQQVYAYNIDDLQAVVSSTQSQRTEAISAARSIVHRHVDEFVAWQSRRELGPAIDALYKRYHALARDEVDRAVAQMPSLSEAQRSQLEETARRIVNKLLHDPVKSLDIADAQHAPQYVHALSKLFALELKLPPDDRGKDQRGDE